MRVSVCCCVPAFVFVIIIAEQWMMNGVEALSSKLIGSQSADRV